MSDASRRLAPPRLGAVQPRGWLNEVPGCALYSLEVWDAACHHHPDIRILGANVCFDCYILKIGCQTLQRSAEGLAGRLFECACPH